MSIDQDVDGVYRLTLYHRSFSTHDSRFVKYFKVQRINITVVYSKAFIFMVTNKAFSDLLVLLVVDLGDEVAWVPLMTKILKAGVKMYLVPTSSSKSWKSFGPPPYKEFQICCCYIIH